MLVPSDDVGALGRAIEQYATPAVARAVGLAARRRAENVLGLDAMVARYAALYDELLVARTRASREVPDGNRVASGSH
jgi:glycosyltransferase involved in cell wall biosynthesis